MVIARDESGKPDVKTVVQMEHQLWKRLREKLPRNELLAHALARRTLERFPRGQRERGRRMIKARRFDLSGQLKMPAGRRTPS